MLKAFFFLPRGVILLAIDGDVVVAVVPKKCNIPIQVAMQLLHRAAYQGLSVEVLRCLLLERLFSSFQVEVL